jgi:hypothetical protein
VSLLPSRRDDDVLLAWDIAKASRAQSRTALAIHQHGLQSRLKAEIDRLDSQAAADALEAGLEEEIRLLNHGLRLAEGSAAKVELVSRKVDLLSSHNNSRFGRRFGG